MAGSLYILCTCAALYTRSSRGVLYTSVTSSRLQRSGAWSARAAWSGNTLSAASASGLAGRQHVRGIGLKRTYVQSVRMTPSSLFHLEMSAGGSVSACGWAAWDPGVFET